MSQVGSRSPPLLSFPTALQDPPTYSQPCSPLLSMRPLPWLVPVPETRVPGPQVWAAILKALTTCHTGLSRGLALHHRALSGLLGALTKVNHFMTAGPPVLGALTSLGCKHPHDLVPWSLPRALQTIDKQ